MTCFNENSLNARRWMKTLPEQLPYLPPPPQRRTTNPVRERTRQQLYARYQHRYERYLQLAARAQQLLQSHVADLGPEIESK